MEQNNQPSQSAAPIPDDKVMMSHEDRDKLARNAARATSFLKAIGHEGRMMILCHLAGGERSVGELEDLLSARQAAVSQHLSRLRQDGLVTSRRHGKTIFYRLADSRPRRVIDVVYELFCED